jgi:hypothetical protein
VKVVERFMREFYWSAIHKFKRNPFVLFAPKKFKEISALNFPI